MLIYLLRYTSDKEKKYLQIPGEKLLSPLAIEFKKKGDKELSKLFQNKIIRDFCGNEYKIAKNKYGKPFIEDFKSFNYNITHSKDIIACAVFKNEVGIDIEYIDEIDYIGIIEHYFSTLEQAEILGSKKPLEYFYTYWTIKESFLKWMGCGLNVNLRSLEVKQSKNQFELYYNDKRVECRIETIILDNKYILTTCEKKSFSHEKKEIVNVKLSDVIN